MADSIENEIGTWGLLCLTTAMRAMAFYVVVINIQYLHLDPQPSIANEESYTRSQQNK
jgi:hypothetical protein